eukprot:g18571.t1
MEEASSSDEDSAPETMPSNTKTAATGSAARAAKAGQRPSDSMSDDDSSGDSGSDGGEDSGSSEKLGKRKADDFLRRQELVMDAGFKATVVLPGDDVTETTTRTTRSLRLGPGLVQHAQDKVLTTRAGVLRYRPPCSYWVESNGKRYGARVEDQVLGVVEDRVGGEAYKVNIFGSSAALLGMLEFDGASKRSKPNLKSGSLVFCRVAAVNKDMDTELTCTSTHHGSKKDWMTGQSTFGELHGGKMERCSLLLAKSLTKPNCRVLKSLAKHMPFELAAGLNGAFWVDSGSEAHTIVICNAILNSEVMTDEQTDAMVDQLAKHMKNELSARIFAMAAEADVVPKLVVFDCDMCLWEPELFQLAAPPTVLDEATNTVISGSDRLKLFEGAQLALRELYTQERFSATQVAVASATSRKESALLSLRLLQISPGVSAGDIIKYREIYPDNKGTHFKRLQEASGIAYSDMLFFDDCNWGDNCRDVEWACPGVVTTKTPNGLTPQKWAEGLAKFAETKR